MSKQNENQAWKDWQRQAPEIYDEIYYQSNFLVAHFNNAGHKLLEAPYTKGDRFERVLEVGGGTGMHLEYVRHSYDEYVLSDINPELIAKARQRWNNHRGVTFALRDATRIDEPDASFDRLISVYNLEHLPRPHEVVREWRRVVRPGGVISIAIPAEGGIAWRLGRFLTTRRAFARKGLDLDYIIAREHINTCYNLVAIFRQEFGAIAETWYPTRLPLTDVNLVYTATIPV